MRYMVLAANRALIYVHLARSLRLMPSYMLRLFISLSPCLKCRLVRAFHRFVIFKNCFCSLSFVCSAFTSLSSHVLSATK